MELLFVTSNWRHLPTAQRLVANWANATFPNRVPEASLSKLVLEEIPELLIHKREKGIENIQGELADCFILLMDLAEIWGVDIADAVRDKMLINAKREWTHDPNTGFYNHKETKQVVGHAPAPCCGSTLGRDPDDGSCLGCG